MSQKFFLKYALTNKQCFNNTANKYHIWKIFNGTFLVFDQIRASNVKLSIVNYKSQQVSVE